MVLENLTSQQSEPNMCFDLFEEIAGYSNFFACVITGYKI